MRLGITAYAADGGKSGISRYVMSLLHEFATLCRGEEVEVFAPQGEVGRFVAHGSPWHVHPGPDILRRPVPGILWHQTVLPRLARRAGLDVLFLPAGNRRIPARCPVPMVGTVHDLSAIHVAGKYDAARGFYIRRVLPWLVRRLDHVLTISESSRRDIIDYAGVPPERVTVIPLAADTQVYRPRDRDQARRQVEQRFGVRAPYVLYVSRIEHPGKNHVRLIRAFGAMKQATGLPHRLVLAGSDWSGADAVHREAEASRFRDAILFTGFAGEETLPDLYAGADVFVFPSLYEGFGLPILEAMACATPVACSNTSSMPEVAGEAAELFDPADEEAIAAALTRLLTDGEHRDALRSAGLERAALFSWRRTAQATLEVLRSMSHSSGGGR